MVAVACVVLVAGLAFAKDPKPEAKLNFIVVKDDNGKPVRNAAVILHAVYNDGKQHRGGLELKTDGEGKASIEGIPYGTLRVQVIAAGFQTYGEDFEVTQTSQDFTIKLKRPQQQYSIYK